MTRASQNPSKLGQSASPVDLSLHFRSSRSQCYTRRASSSRKAPSGAFLELLVDHTV